MGLLLCKLLKTWLRGTLKHHRWHLWSTRDNNITAEPHCVVTSPELLSLARGSMPLPRTLDMFYPKCLSCSPPANDRHCPRGSFTRAAWGLLSPVPGKAELLLSSLPGSPSSLHSFPARLPLAPHGYRALRVASLAGCRIPHVPRARGPLIFTLKHGWLYSPAARSLGRS